MSNTKHGFASTLCRCGRTTALDNNNGVARRALDCGHYICADCWHYNQPMPSPLCGTCVVALQNQEITRLSFYTTAYNDLLGRYKELEKIHIQRMVEYKTASDSIAMLKSKLAAFHKGQSHSANAAASSSSPQAPAQPLPNIQNISSSSAGTVGTNKSAMVVDWGSDSGKLVSSYLAKQREIMAACQKECDTLKSRIAELTAELEAKNQANSETVTAVEKAELMEAELEGLHARLDKCEEDLQNAQSELATTKTRNGELTKEIAEFREKTRTTLAKAQFQITSLHNRCNAAERDLASARESLKAKDEVIRTNARAHSRDKSADLSISSASTDRTAVYIPTAVELEQTASKLTSLQNEVAKLNREKTALEREISSLKEELKAREEENQVLGGKLLTSAELASELGRIHLAASARAEAAENKLSAAEKEVQDLKELMEVQERENKAMQDTMSIASGLSKHAAYQSRVAQLEAELAETTRLRDEALAQLEGWEQNRNAWKRWGEVMALRAKQWEDEALRAKVPRVKSGVSPVHLEEPPPLPPLDIVSGGPLPAPGKTRKRPLDMPDTDVDGLDATAQTGVNSTSDADGEGTERKKARFVQAS